MSTDGNGTGTALVGRVEEASPASPFGAGAEGFNVAQRIAQALSKSSVVPKDYQNNLPNVLVAMEYANRLGASVLAVMQNLDIVQGRPSLRATFLIGTVNACGRFTPIRFRWHGTEGKDDWGCRAVATDRESGEECVGPLITIGLAKAEGWHGKSGSKWKSIPELMLMYRAGAWWTRVYCPELSLGMHTTEEVVDFDSRPARSAGAQELNAALRPALPSGDNASARLEIRLLKARERDLVSAEDDQAIQDVLAQEDADGIAMWISELDNRRSKQGELV